MDKEILDQRGRELLHRGRWILEQSWRQGLAGIQAPSGKETYLILNKAINQVSREIKASLGEERGEVLGNLPPSKRAEEAVKAKHRRARSGLSSSMDLALRGIPLASSMAQASFQKIYSVARSLGFRGMARRDLIYMVKVFQFAHNPSSANLRQLKSYASAMRRKEAGLDLDLERAIKETSLDLSRALTRQEGMAPPSPSPWGKGNLVDDFIYQVAYFAYDLRKYEESRNSNDLFK